jgi:hypothetical protein
MEAMSPKVSVVVHISQAVGIGRPSGDVTEVLPVEHIVDVQKVAPPMTKGATMQVANAPPLSPHRCVYSLHNLHIVSVCHTSGTV